MQFLLIAYDGTDEGAAARREAARPAHIARVTELKAAGHIRIGGAILDESGAAVGSAAVFEFEARADLDRYLEADPTSPRECGGTSRSPPIAQPCDRGERD